MKDLENLQKVAKTFINSLELTKKKIASSKKFKEIKEAGEAIKKLTETIQKIDLEELEFQLTFMIEVGDDKELLKLVEDELQLMKVKKEGDTTLEDTNFILLNGLRMTYEINGTKFRSKNMVNNINKIISTVTVTKENYKEKLNDL